MFGLSLMAIAFLGLSGTSLTTVLFIVGLIIALLGFGGAYRISKILDKRMGVTK